MWKGKCCGKDVAVKVIRTYSDSELQKTINVSYGFCSIRSRMLIVTMHGIEVLQGGRDVEISSTPPKYPATGRNDDVGKFICNGIGLDAKWRYPRICRGASRRRPDEARTFSTCNLASSVL